MLATGGSDVALAMLLLSQLMVAQVLSPRVRRLLRRASRAKDLGTIIKNSGGGFFLAVGAGLISGVLTVADIFIVPAQALIGGLEGIIDGFFGGIGLILGAGAEATARSFAGAFNLGPFTFPAAVGISLLVLWMIGRYRDEEETGNLIPGLPFDVPFVGESEEAPDS